MYVCKITLPPVISHGFFSIQIYYRSKPWSLKTGKIGSIQKAVILGLEFRLFDRA